MGRWFPGIRRAAPEQVREYAKAQKAVFRGQQDDRAAGIRDIRDVAPRYYDLQREANRTAEPLSGPQRFWHFNRALIATDLEAGRQKRDARRQRKGRTR